LPQSLIAVFSSEKLPWRSASRCISASSPRQNPCRGWRCC
jgi:hypothetical protein